MARGVSMLKNGVVREAAAAKPVPTQRRPFLLDHSTIDGKNTSIQFIPDTACICT